MPHEEAVVNGGTTVHQRRGSIRSIYSRAFDADRAYEAEHPSSLPSSWGELFGGKPVQAELHGQAEVKGKAKVTISIPGRADRDVRVPLRGAVNANGAGSLGVSSPDAAAHPAGVGHN